MGDKTGIQWTNSSWNPIAGCSIVSPGCRLCYAMGEAARQIRCAAGLKRETHYTGTVETKNGRPIWTGKINAAPDHIWTLPLRWRRPRRIFVNSMSDLFHEDVPFEWIDRAFATMALSPQHTFQVLTKRGDRMRDYFTRNPAIVWDDADRLACSLQLREPDRPGYLEAGRAAAGWPLPNVWLGVSTERQKEADERIPDLLATPAAVRFISAEPLLGPIDLARYLVPSMHVGPTEKPLTAEGARAIAAIGRAAAKKMGAHFLDWVIVGGESGKHAKPMNPQWARDLRDQCHAANVKFFFKQWGEFVSVSEVAGDGPHFKFPDGRTVRRLGVKKAGRLLDGREHNDFPNIGGGNG